MIKLSRPHDDTVVELLRADPAFADEYPSLPHLMKLINREVAKLC